MLQLKSATEHHKCTEMVIQFLAYRNAGESSGENACQQEQMVRFG